MTKPTTREEIDRLVKSYTLRTPYQNFKEACAIALRESERADALNASWVASQDGWSQTSRDLVAAEAEIARLRRETHVAGCGCTPRPDPPEFRTLSPFTDPRCAAKREGKS